MTEITAPKSAVTAEQFADEIREQLKYTQGVTVEQAKPADVYVAASAAVRRHLVDSWMKTQADMVNGNTKAVGYLSAEFLMGKQLENALLNAGLTDQFNKAVKDLGFSAQEIIDAEYEPGLGNGGLGRLAACFIDSLASLGVPAFGYGIQYKYGIFKQEFDENGKQIETPDYWLANEEPWGHIDYNRDQKVSFGGEVVEENGKKVWKPAWSVRAVPVDYMVPGYASGRVNTLRLWTAKSYDEFDLLTFNKSEYLDAVKPQVEAENISKILYPEDSTPQGKALRLEQQYFFVSASIHDAIRAGFTKVVFIVKPEILGLVRTLCGDSLRGKTTRGGKPLEVCYAFQDFESLPAFYTLPAGRTKPFGTTHAVLCARDYVNEPFCVINADDYYGVDAYRAMYDLSLIHI